MVSVPIRKEKLFDLLHANNLEFTDELYEKAADVIEQKCAFKLIRPVGKNLRHELSVKFTLLRAGWNRLFAENAKEKFRRDLTHATFKITLTNEDVTQDTLIIKYSVCQKELENTWAEKFKLEKDLKRASAELKKMEVELERTKEFLEVTKTKKDLEVLARANCLTGNNSATEPTSHAILSSLLTRPTRPDARLDLSVSNYVSQCIINERVGRDLKKTASKKFQTKPLADTAHSVEMDECEAEAEPKDEDRIKMIAYKRKAVLRKNYFKLSSRHQRRTLVNIKKTIAESLNYLEDMGLKLTNVEISPRETDTDEENFRLKVMSAEELQNMRSPNVNNLLYYKDKYSISDKCYSDLKVSIQISFSLISMTKPS
jgi:hypothetical protein